jgi:hypothetical protein
MACLEKLLKRTSEVSCMSEKNDMDWSLVIIGVVFTLLAGSGAGMTVGRVLHSHPGWVLPFYGVVTGIFTGFGAVLLLTVLSSLKQEG